jgi:hypothetical protein
MIVPIPYVLMGIGGLTAAVSIPLVMRWIPMNMLYGVRIKKAFVSDRNWYGINAYGGKLLLVYGLCLSAFGWITMDWAPPPTSLWSPVYLGIPLLIIFPIMKLIYNHVKKYPDR